MSQRILFLFQCLFFPGIAPLSETCLVRMAAELLSVCHGPHMPTVVKAKQGQSASYSTGSTQTIPWRYSRYVWLKAGLIASLVTLLYADVLIDLAHDWWTEPNLSHGLLIPPLAALIAWGSREKTFRLPVRPDSRGLLAVASACLLYILGKVGAEFFLPRISFVWLLAGLVWTFWGAARLRSLAFPLVLLATMVPLPALVYNSMAAPLQLFASDVAAKVAEAAGVSVYRDGNIISLAHISLGVEEACSGLNSLAALMVGSLLLGFLQCSRIWIRCLLFGLSIPLSIAVNVVRVSGTAILADYHEEFAMGFYHSFSGWLVFVAGFAALYGVSRALHYWFERGMAAREAI
jgi:exosortase